MRMSSQPLPLRRPAHRRLMDQIWLRLRLRMSSQRRLRGLARLQRIRVAQQLLPLQLLQLLLHLLLTQGRELKSHHLLLLLLLLLLPLWVYSHLYWLRMVCQLLSTCLSGQRLRLRLQLMSSQLL